MTIYFIKLSSYVASSVLARLCLQQGKMNDHLLHKVVQLSTDQAVSAIRQTNDHLLHKVVQLCGELNTGKAISATRQTMRTKGEKKIKGKEGINTYTRTHTHVFMLLLFL